MRIFLQTDEQVIFYMKGEPMTNDRALPPVSFQLPWEVRMALRRASLTPVSFADPLARVKAIEVVMVKARFDFPKLFRV